MRRFVTRSILPSHGSTCRAVVAVSVRPEARRHVCIDVSGEAINYSHTRVQMKILHSKSS